MRYIQPAVSLLTMVLCGLVSAQQPGAHVSVRTADGISLTYISDNVAIVGASNAHIDRRLSDRPIAAEIKGLLLIQQDGDYRFQAKCNGTCQVTLDGQQILASEKDTPWIESEPVRLASGFVPFRVDYNPAAAPTQAAPTKAPPTSFRLFWSGPGFDMIEPVGGRYVFHESERNAATAPSQGVTSTTSDLIQANRCNACHSIDGRPLLKAPSLANLTSDKLNYAWLVDWIAGNSNSDRHCPTYGFDRKQANQIAAHLLPLNRPSSAPVKGDTQNGEILFASVGCLACHYVRATDGTLLGSSGEFGGGDLSGVATKRPAEFFERWLESPEKINANHRMPVFDLTDKERTDLAAYLATLGNTPDRGPTESNGDSDSQNIGKSLVSDANCSACHNTTIDEKHAIIPINSWKTPCSAPPHSAQISQPRFKLSTEQQNQIRRYIEACPSPSTQSTPTPAELLAENNCLACHQRGLNLAEDLSETAENVVEMHSELAGQFAALLPPSLNQIGDKLTNAGLRRAIDRNESPLRPWLRLRMPRFRLSDTDVGQLVSYFATQDRLPADSQHRPINTEGPRVEHHESGRLVGADGFNCASCHSIGAYEPADAPVNTRGPNLTAVVGRVRPEWFSRWVRNPIRIVPNVEMPSISVPVQGVLDDDLDQQIAAVWSAIRDPKFTIPDVRPFRVLRQSGNSSTSMHRQRAIVLTDVLKVQHEDGDLETFLKPFALGLANRQNVLFDLGSGSLAGWWLGDLAGQINKGKRWHWQANIRNHLAKGAPKSEKDKAAQRSSDIVLVSDGQQILPMRIGQFVTRADTWRHVDGSVELNYRLRFPTSNDTSPVIHVRRQFTPTEHSSNGFTQTIECTASSDATIRVIVASKSDPTVSSDKRQLDLDSDSHVLILGNPADSNSSQSGATEFSGDGTIALRLTKDRPAVVQLAYATDLDADYFASAPTVSNERTKPTPMDVVPGFVGTKLPIDEPFMPTGLTWGDDGSLFVASLDGRIWHVKDTDEDGHPDSANEYGDELSTPYGIKAGDGYVDVVDKTALLRLRDRDNDGRADEFTTLAAGWGHTDDYHDWVVGLESDSSGNYYVAIPCQQDDRSEAAAHLRGKVLRLSPSKASPGGKPESYSIHKITGGHRFPHGIARNRAGALFVTDNQGNFNPFNELNHVVQGRRFGFINRLERKPDFKPELTPPAINIPHPWTRSVNGICFLESPPTARSGSQATGDKYFGPFEGHIVGCEYDTRRLVRMSVQNIGNEFQGAVYPFSYAPSSSRPTQNRSAIPGPIVCEIGPDGDLYIGSLRESGWGGGKNTGEIVRLSPSLANIPPGIAEIRATNDGFEIEFTRAINQQLAGDQNNYHVMSYTRVSTPKYGGDDVDRSEEKLATVQVASDRLVRIQLQNERKLGYVYEFRLDPLVENSEFFPAEGYYTLNRLP